MKKVFLLLWVCLITPLIYCQTDTSTLLGKYQYACSNLNINNVSTNILYDRTFPFETISDHTGSNTSTNLCTKKIWEQLYLNIFNSAFTHEIVITRDSINTIASPYLVAGKVPLLITNLLFNEIKENALEDSLILFDGEKYQDANSPSETPYNENRFFSITTLSPTKSGTIITFILPSLLIITNDVRSINKIEIDFGDGNGS